MPHPSNIDYEDKIRNCTLFGNSPLNSHNYYFIPVSTYPFKRYLHGSGKFACVYKAKSENENKEYAIRFLLSDQSDIEKRYDLISSYLEEKKPFWAIKTGFYRNEITIENTDYPVIIMEWTKGEPLNKFILENIENRAKLTRLQKSFLELYDSLEQDGIGHGDIQPGNIFVKFNRNKLELKLIDYDNMYVPKLNGCSSNEMGLPGFQHPHLRNETVFIPHIDRFSIWIFLLTIEAIKEDPAIWENKNDDSLLFKEQDLIDPFNSDLFNRIKNYNNINLNKYANIVLSSLQKNNYDDIPIPRDAKDLTIDIDSFENDTWEPQIIQEATLSQSNYYSSSGKVLITSGEDSCTVLNRSLKPLGKTPCEIDRSIGTVYVFSGKSRLELNLEHIDTDEFECKFAKQKPSQTLPKSLQKNKSKSFAETITYKFSIAYSDSDNNSEPKVVIENHTSNQEEKYSDNEISYQCIKGDKLSITIKCDGYEDEEISIDKATKYNNSREILLNAKSPEEPKESLWRRFKNWARDFWEDYAAIIFWGGVIAVVIYFNTRESLPSFNYCVERKFKDITDLNESMCNISLANEFAKDYSKWVTQDSLKSRLPYKISIEIDADRYENTDIDNNIDGLVVLGEYSNSMEHKDTFVTLFQTDLNFYSADWHFDIIDSIPIVSLHNYDTNGKMEIKFSKDVDKMSIIKVGRVNDTIYNTDWKIKRVDKQY